MSDIIISKKNEVYLKIISEPHVAHELSDQFTFDIPGAKYMPQYRNRPVSYTHLTLPTIYSV